MKVISARIRSLYTYKYISGRENQSCVPKLSTLQQISPILHRIFVPSKPNRVAAGRTSNKNVIIDHMRKPQGNQPISATKSNRSHALLTAKPTARRGASRRQFTSVLIRRPHQTESNEKPIGQDQTNAHRKHIYLHLITSRARRRS